MTETTPRLPNEANTSYWKDVRERAGGRGSVFGERMPDGRFSDIAAKLLPRLFSKKSILDLHKEAGHVEDWDNLVDLSTMQAARARALGELAGMPNWSQPMENGSMGHNLRKRKELEVTREANKKGTSPLAAVKPILAEVPKALKDAGFSRKIRRLASAPRGYAPQLIEVDRIVRKWEKTGRISNRNAAYLAVHYVSDLASGPTGTDWVTPSKRGSNEQIVYNVVDTRAEENNEKVDYTGIIQEIAAELQGTPLEGMNTHDAMAMLSHKIEDIFAPMIEKNIGRSVNPRKIPEMIDQKIREKIEQV